MQARPPGVPDALGYGRYLVWGLFLAFLLVTGHWPGWVLVAFALISEALLCRLSGPMVNEP
jgi:phosphatidylglycerophosphate synthase